MGIKRYGLALLMIAIVPVLTIAHASTESSVVMRATSGVVDIQMETEPGLKDITSIVPGQSVPFHVQLSNSGEPAWVRLAVSTDHDSVISTMNENDRWVRHGDYWYYTEPLLHAGMLQVETAFEAPVDWNETLSGESVGVTISADAVQSANVTPDFSSEYPWGTSVIDRYEGSATAVNTGTFRIVCEGGSGLSVSAEDTFGVLSDRLMPGDIRTSDLVLQNQTSAPVRTFLRMETVDNALTEQTEISVSIASKQIYQGKLCDPMAEMYLMSLGVDDTAKISVSLSTPLSVGNDFANLTADDITMIFRYEIDSANDVNTGDSDALRYLMLCGLAVFLWKKSERKVLDV